MDQLESALKASKQSFLASEDAPTLADLVVWSSLFVMQASAPAAVSDWMGRISSKCHATGIAAAAAACPRSEPEAEVEEQDPAEFAKQQFYLTTAINYTNGPPHMGHAYEGVTSDIISRCSS